jgi:membrane associated rhomboid family serine protease
MTPWVFRLLLANGAVYLLQMAMPQVTSAFALVPALVLQRPWTVLSYMFLHGGLGHLFFNMLSLFFFGPRLEARLGSRRFLILYFVSGATGALLSLVFSPWAAVIGASGGVFGVLLGFARYWPRDQILIWGVFPVEARWMVAGMTILALLGGFSGGGGIAHFAHLGGFLGGWLSLKVFEQTSPAKRFQRRVAPAPPRESAEASLARWSRIKRDSLHEVNRAELDRILDKISAHGIQSLTPGDREFLERFSARESLPH